MRVRMLGFKIPAKVRTKQSYQEGLSSGILFI